VPAAAAALLRRGERAVQDLVPLLTALAPARRGLAAVDLPAAGHRPGGLPRRALKNPVAGRCYLSSPLRPDPGSAGHLTRPGMDVLVWVQRGIAAELVPLQAGTPVKTTDTAITVRGPDHFGVGDGPSAVSCPIRRHPIRVHQHRSRRLQAQRIACQLAVESQRQQPS